MKAGFGAVLFSAIFPGLAQCLAQCPWSHSWSISARLRVTDTTENKTKTLWKAASEALGLGPHAATSQSLAQHSPGAIPLAPFKDPGHPQYHHLSPENAGLSIIDTIGFLLLQVSQETPTD